MPSDNTVAVVKTEDYGSVEDAVAAALNLIDAGKRIDAEDRVLLKPNLLMKIKNACTESDFLAAVARFLGQYNRHLQIGDSPGQFKHRAKSIIKALGLDTVIAAEGLEYKDFEAGGVLVTNTDARHMRHHHIARPVIEADWIVNLCRPKSHMEATYTGAVKNFWGIIPGGEKANCHLYGKNPDEFGEVITDNYQSLLDQNKKHLVVMDARRFMEGPGGPANGHMRKVGLILAGYDEVAVDLVMLAIGGRDAFKEVPHLKACKNRNIGVASLKEVNIVGQPPEAVRLKRKISIISSRMARLMNNFITRPLSYKIMRRMPVLRQPEDCVMCGDCYNICPNNAISWEKNQTPEFDRQRCISCLCCVECCPQQALEARAAGISGLFLKYPEIKPPAIKAESEADQKPTED